MITIEPYNHKEIYNIGLKPISNQLFVSADFFGFGSLTANRGNFDAWETYDLILVNPDKNHVAFRSHANKLYVCAKNCGNSHLSACSFHIQGWETFEMNKQDQGYSFKSLANGHYVSVDWSAKLIPNKKEVDNSTKFNIYQKNGSSNCQIDIKNRNDKKIQDHNKKEICHDNKKIQDHKKKDINYDVKKVQLDDAKKQQQKEQWKNKK